MALGAKPAGIIRNVLSSGVAITLAGAAVGLGVGLAMTTLVRSLLFGVSTYDPLTVITAPSLLIAVTVAACLLPEVRASRVEPTSALRMD